MSIRGRPRSFNREKALQCALELFWRRGYEGATLVDLQRAMGSITPTSLYAAFGSKERLFREAMELLIRTAGAPPLAALTTGADARASIEGMLRASVEYTCQPGKPHGCITALGAINGTQRSRRIQEYLQSMRQLRGKFIRERLLRGVADGDLSKDVDLDQIVSFYVTVLNGLAIQAHDGASKQETFATVEYAMAAWEAIVQRRGKKQSSEVSTD